MLLIVCSILIAGCSVANRSPVPLAEYAEFAGSERNNLPESYIDFLRKTRFTHGELDHLPPFAVILYGNPEKYLARLGVTADQYSRIELGTTDPNALYVVRPPGHAPFLLNWGLPGGGGVATQAAELIALGSTHIVHIGTSGLIGPEGDDRHVVIASAAYKDGAAVMLSDGPPIERLARADAVLNALFARLLERDDVPSLTMTGYTIPIYYFQPSGLIDALLRGPEFADSRPQYIEMEEASFFETARRMHVAAASLTAGADRYTIENGVLKHDFLDDGNVTATLTSALRATMDVFDELHRAGGATRQSTGVREVLPTKTYQRR